MNRVRSGKSKLISPKRRLGALKGRGRVPDDFDDPLPRGVMPE